MSFKETEVGKIPEDWKINTVEELVKEEILDKPLDGNHGGIHPKGSDFIDDGIPFVMASDIKGREVDFLSCKFISEEQANSLKKGFAKEGDILITHKATIGLSAIVKNIDTNFIILTPQVTYYRVLDYEKLDNLFLLYYFKYEGFKKLFENWAGGGSTRLYLGITNQRRLPIVLPPIEEQKAIAKILSDLDNKIEVNNKINQRLEDMAQSIFKHWFVDFEFPNEEGKPYKSSGGEMVESELGMIPKGWELECVYNLGEYINGTSFKSKDLGDKGLPIIKIAELKNGITDGTKFFDGEKDNKFYLKNRDILFSWSGNPDTSIDTFIWDKGDAILNQHIFKVIPNLNSGYSYVYILLRSLKSTFTNIARNKQTTGLGHVTVKDLKNLKVALNYDKINEFNKMIEPIINKIINNNNSVINITQLRDTLLPKLMNGEIRVPIKNNK